MFYSDNKDKKFFSFDFCGKNISFEVDSLALRGEKSVLCRYGDTTVLTTLCLNNDLSGSDFVRLTIFLDEKFYSIRRIPSAFNKRESKNTYQPILVARMIDRSLRSCFSSGDKKEIQITNTILSLDDNYDFRIASCWNSILVSLLSENLSFSSLISMVVVAKNEDQFICNPSFEQLKKSPFELIVTASKEKILMLEMFGDEISEEEIEAATQFALSKIRIIIDDFLSLFLTSDLAFKKENFVRLSSDSSTEDFDEIPNLKNDIANCIREIFHDESQLNSRRSMLELCLQKLVKKYEKLDYLIVESLWFSFLKKRICEDIVSMGRRIDGRGVDQIREISVKTDYLPNVHGSALFSRGLTNVISVLTFGKNSERQLIDDALSLDNYHKHFIHHYNFPGFAVNSLSSPRGVSRREIGHGQLVEKTFSYLIPSLDEFPYTTRIVSEVLSSDGSSSQASICASSLSMMLAGFPLKRHVAGIALGLFDNVIITDINDLEDKIGEMDFKIAGTKDGICSFQLDIKNDGITFDLFTESLKRGRIARLSIIEKMEDKISGSRKYLPQSIIKCKKFYIGSENIGLIIGPGGRNINAISSKTGSKIDFQEDGFVLIYHLEEQKALEAYEMIKRSLATSKSRTLVR